MAAVILPYGKSSVEIDIPDDKINGILYSNAEEYEAEGTQQSIVRDSLENPVDSQKLCELAKNVARVLIITSDHTRPVPSKITMPILLEEIRRYNPSVEVKIIIATGFHRLTTYEELVFKLGQEIVSHEDIVIHDSKDNSSMVFKGILPSGGELWINSLVDWADLVVAEGFIEPHFFAGFSGGRKSVLPGIASKKTVLANHCSTFISSPKARTGNLEENPIHKDMLFAAEAAGLKFILNVVLDGKKRIIKSFSGDSRKAHIKGCSFVSELSRVSPMYSDIVITTNGGYPLDQNIYQAVKSMSVAEMTVNRSGVIIILSACEDGHGGEAFYKWFKDSSGPKEVASKIESISQDETVADQWEAQILARILVKNKVIMVSEKCSRQFIEDMYMTYAGTIEEAIDMAYSIVGSDAKITVIPDGISVIVDR